MIAVGGVRHNIRKGQGTFGPLPFSYDFVAAAGDGILKVGLVDGYDTFGALEVPAGLVAVLVLYRSHTWAD